MIKKILSFIDLIHVSLFKGTYYGLVGSNKLEDEDEFYIIKIIVICFG